MSKKRLLFFNELNGSVTTEAGFYDLAQSFPIAEKLWQKESVLP